ncbi:hypothetical protein FOPG_19206 [Fusarium oxysporum f. sp. conglutinans race 2 54008]|uniref:Uncharacterized protein n=1 Tax=Fusarium oxysporum f. sp. conglutinans race 2 54008 TaxID=1089457 RepID=X0HTM7_FUSOX|nr:hypothetical protein FOPG_19206 [Fusarium oxysporum f. sp. conglutinans race 2 54008]
MAGLALGGGSSDQIQDDRVHVSATTALPWRPFGHVKKSLAELELWPQLEANYTRRYNALVWYPRKSFSILDEGFRKDTGQHIINVTVNSKMHTSTKYSEKTYCVTNMRPSKDSMAKMMGFFVEGVGGGRDWANAGLSMQPKQLRWLRD